MSGSPDSQSPHPARLSSGHGVRVLSNFSSLAAARLLGALLEFIAQILVARAWGPAAFGVVAFGRTTANYFGIAADPGLSMVGMRAVARRDHSVNEIRQFARARALTTAVSALLMTCFAIRLAPAQTRPVVLAYLTLVLPFGLSFEWLFKGLERMWLVAVVRVVRSFVLLGLTVVVVSVTRSTILYALGEGLSWCLSSVLLYLYARRYIDDHEVAATGPRLTSLIMTSAPIGLAWLLTTAYQLGAVVLLTFISGPEQAGLYAAAQRPVIFLHGFGVLLGESLVATFVRAADAGTRGDLTLTTTVITLAVLLPVSISMLVGAGSVATLLFGPEFLLAAPVLKLLLWQSLFLLLNIPFYVTLVARGRERAYLRAIAIGAVATLALDIVVIPRFGAVGAACVAVVVELAVLTLVILPARAHLALRGVRSSVTAAFTVSAVSLALALLVPGPALGRLSLSLLAGWLTGAAMLRTPLRSVLSGPSPAGPGAAGEPEML